MTHDTYIDGILRERRSDATRLVTTYSAAGAITGTRAYTADENTAADASAAAEVARAERLAQEARDRAILDATAETMSKARADGAAWVQPTGAHDAYALGLTVAYAGKTWTNITPANVWPPGVTGWREVVASGPAAWVQPLGAHDAYPLGAKVTHKGKTWTSTAAANVWKPGVYGWV